MRRLLGVGLLGLGMLGIAIGQGGPQFNDHDNDGKHLGQGRQEDDHFVPEINPAQAISALALLSGGLLIIRRKR